MSKVVYTKRCEAGNCTGWSGEPAYISDLDTVCDHCLLERFGLNRERYDGCGDPLSMNPLYDRDDVVAALRAASGL